jgi:hypothetical protein
MRTLRGLIWECGYASMYALDDTDYRKIAADLVKARNLKPAQIDILRHQWVAGETEALQVMAMEQHSECLAESCLPGEWLCAETKCGQYNPA